MNTPHRKDAPKLAGEQGNERLSEHTPLLIGGHKEAAKSLGISERKVQELTACNALPHYRIGRKVNFSPDELRAWIAAGCPTQPGVAVRIRQNMHRGGAA